MNTSLKIGMASVLAIATASPAFAQYQPQYQPQQHQQAPGRTSRRPARSTSRPRFPPIRSPAASHQQDRQGYEAPQGRSATPSRDAYDARRDNYEGEPRRLPGRLVPTMTAAMYDGERARADYDARYGYGAYIRVLRPGAELGRGPLGPVRRDGGALLRPPERLCGAGSGGMP